MARKKNKENEYFDENVEAAIRELVLNKNLTQSEYESLYLEKVHDAFVKLAENVLYTYGQRHGLLSMEVDSAELIEQGVSFMYSKINRFDPEKMSNVYKKTQVKAFSFFGTIVKRYYIQLSISYQRNTNRTLRISDPDITLSIRDANTLSINNVKKDIHKQEIELFTKEMISWFTRHKDYMFEDENEWKIGQAILTLFSKASDLETTDKKKIYIFLREITNVEQRKITPVVKKMSEQYRILRKNYNRYGIVYSGSLK